MKITTDYVTNSSSANYVIARKGKLNKSQIKKLACFKTGHLVVTNALKQQKKAPVCSV